MEREARHVEAGEAARAGMEAAGSAPLRGRLLLISVIDPIRQPNNREHHLIRHLPAAFDETTVIFKRRNPPRAALAMLGEMLVPEVREFRREGVRYLEVNTFLNHYPGMSRDLTGAQPDVGTGPGSAAGPGAAAGPRSGGAVTGRARRGGVRGLLLSAASTLGMGKDAALALSLLVVALERGGGTFDVCIALGPWSGLVGWVLRKTGRVRCLVYEDRDYEPAFVVSPPRRAALVRLERFLMRRADLLVCIGDGLAGLRRDETGREDVAVISTGVDTARFRPARERPAHPPTLIYTGNLTWWSGLETVLVALPDVIRAVPEARLLVVGGGIASYERRLRDAAARLGVQDRVDFAGPQPHESLPGFLLRSDIGLACFPPNPLRRFAVPLKVFEYMAAGLPSIVTVGTESEGIVRRCGCGVAIDFEPRALAAAATRLLTDPALRASLAESAVRHSGAYDWSVLLEEEKRLIAAARARLAAGRAA